MKHSVIYVFTIILILASVTAAECSLDHFIIGCNEDAIVGTGDDNKLFVDCRQKYRHSGTPEYLYWYYPLNESIFTEYKWRIGEPGFDGFQNTNPDAVYTYDPNRSLSGTPYVDYEIMVECISLSPGLRAVHKDYPQFTIDLAEQSFSHSYIHYLRGDAHMHMSYQAQDGENLYWITWQIYDAIEDANQYEPSEPFTIVFNREPLYGDLAVDGTVDINDLAELCYYWLSDDGSIHNDYYERADANRDKSVDIFDFALLAMHWLESIY